VPAPYGGPLAATKTGARPYSWSRRPTGQLYLREDNGSGATSGPTKIERQLQEESEEKG
jgi:hypothetical protein